MADYLIHDSTLEDISDAIRSKTGGSALITPEDMPTEIASIETGGGAVGYTLLASGTYTLDANASSMTIPVSFSGNPVIVFVKAQTISSGGNSVHAWLYMNMPVEETVAMFSPVTECRLANGSSVLANRYTATVTLNNDSIVLYQYSGSIPIRANTYDWYIWGVAQ